MSGDSTETTEVTSRSVFRLSSSVKPLRYHLQFDIPFHNRKGPPASSIASVAEIFCTSDAAVSSFALHSLGLTIISVRLRPTSSSPADRSHDIVKEIMSNKLASPILPSATTFETTCEAPISSEGPLPMSIDLPPNVAYIGEDVPISVAEDKASETLVFAAAGPLPINFSLLIHYHAPLSPTCADDTKGLFCSNSENGNFISTQLEPTLSRCLYPCFDEPSFKANFQVCLFVHPSYQAVSNTAIANVLKIPKEYAPGRFNPDEIEPVEGTSSVQLGSTPTTDITVNDVWRYRYTFYETPRISPCLVAFATGDFHVLETETKRGLTTRVIFPKNNNINNGWYAVDLLKKAVEFFESFFSFELPVTKVDIVALQEMRPLGMENWAMITLNAAYTLVDEKTSLERRQRIARLIGHEVAHQWFGNIISIAWWDEIWLKEGFCRYLEFVFVHQVFPKWHIWAEFMSKIADTALCMDCNPDATHPVLCNVGDPRRIFDMFDTISYAKGASILRMVASLVGDRVMASALTSLVHKHAYSNFTTRDFLDCINLHYTDASLDIEALVMQLITVPNHPLLYVELDPEGNYKVSQFEMPNLASGLLPAMIESRIVKMNPPPAATPFVNEMKSASSFSPLSPHRITPAEFTVDPRGRFPNDPSDWLSLSDFTVPLRAVTLVQGQTSSSRILVLTKNVTTIHMGKQALEEDPNAVAPVLYFNFSGCGVFRCDFETKLWKQVFSVAPYLTHNDRLTITLSLFRFRTIHMGVSPREDEDRCTLLLQWLLNFSAGHPQQLNSTIWSVIASELTNIVYFLRGSHCWDDFCHFIHHIFMPLIVDNVVTLSPRENSADFQATKSISSETCFSILHILAITKCTYFDEDAKNIFKWMMASVCKVTGLGAAAADLLTEEHQVPFDISDDEHRSRAFAATEFLCERGNQTVWWVILSICLQLQNMKWEDLSANKRAHVPQASPRTPSQMSIGADPLMSSDSATNFLSGDVTMIFSPPTDIQVDVDPVFLENAAYKQKLLQLLLPAVLGYDDWSTCPPIASLCLKISGMTTPMARSIIRNTNLLLEILALGRRRISSKFLLSFCSLAASHSSNYELIVKLREFTTEALEAQHARTLAAEGSNAATSIMSPLFNSLIEKSEGMDLNLAWVEYVCPHYTNYLQGLRSTLHHNRNGSDIGLTPVANYLSHAPVAPEEQHRSTDEVEI